MFLKIHVIENEKSLNKSIENKTNAEFSVFPKPLKKLANSSEERFLQLEKLLCPCYHNKLIFRYIWT